MYKCVCLFMLNCTMYECNTCVHPSAGIAVLHNYLSKPCTIGQFANTVLLHCPVACWLEHSQESGLFHYDCNTGLLISTNNQKHFRPCVSSAAYKRTSERESERERERVCQAHSISTHNRHFFESKAYFL